MSLPGAAQARIEAITGAPVAGNTALHGGDIAAVWRVDLADGRHLAAKLGANLAIEGWMLGYLKTHARTPVPAVLLANDDLLLMEFIANDGALDPFAETHLGDVIAALHAHEDARFGLDRDTVIGGLPQINTQADDWREFFREHRLLAMARAGLDAGRLPGAVMARVEKLCGRLHVWIRSDAKPALIHGDLWGGNILSRGAKIVGLIDPAIYYADPEIELAFMTLFNSVGKKFFARYARHRPLREGFFEERRDLYNLYPLLVHVRLFGGAYVAQVEGTLARYGC